MEREETEPHVRFPARGSSGSKESLTPPTSRHFSPLIPSVNQLVGRVLKRSPGGLRNAAVRALGGRDFHSYRGRSAILVGYLTGMAR
ncbi:hypothetical protein GCM10010361_76630 [Streptomyces olivaceiscleroticus]|uniref:Uncharacterized protein n=1 Tax=Streptomyces olivaceiscleroticus TaxID=68245 RepID=A0ABN1BKE0_9ACTN